MPKEIPKSELNEILSLIKSCPEGMTTPEIQQALTFSLSTRTMQRRLIALEEAGEVSSSSSTRPKRYRIAHFYDQEESPVSYIAEDGVELITFSKASREIHALVNQPMGLRTPVGYNPAFLESYQPNETYYLDVETREKLLTIGNVGFQDAPAGTYIRDVLDRLLIDLSWNSSRLEGNTYSLLETEKLLAQGEAAEGKNARETQMILNHKEAIELLANQASDIGFNPYTICNLHALLSNNLLSSSTACGSIRSRAVGISGSVYTPLAVPQQVDEFFQLILKKAEQIRDPFEQAFFSMVHLPYLQPFEDVNKRVSRLSANIPLIRRNLCPLSFTDVPQEDYVRGLIGVYELNRVDSLRDIFIWAYKRSAQQFSVIRESLGEPDPFRLKHRNSIKAAIRNVILNQDTPEAPHELTTDEKKLFSSIITTELKSLHIGNIARYGIRPSQFKEWEERC